MTDYERGYEQGKADVTGKMHPELRKFYEDYFDRCFKEYAKYNPPIRQWVGLTDEEIDHAAEQSDNYSSFIAGALFAQDKLEGKNGG
jgi:hypothetical protein